MKHIITLLVALIVSVAGYADVVRNGNVITVTKTTTYVNEKQSIGIYYQDAKGYQYPIYKSNKGKFYVIRTSWKTGKEYKYYLPKKLQQALINEGY